MLLIRSDRFCLDEETQHKKERQEDSKRGEAADGLILSASYLEISQDLHGGRLASPGGVGCMMQHFLHKRK